MNAKAYLIVICDKETNAIVDVEIWSSPEWEQSRQLPNPTYVAFVAHGDSFHEARKSLVQQIRHPSCRYNWLSKYFDDES